MTTSHETSKKIQMFVCGPTVYDYIHIGNARTFVFFDIVAKYLRHQGYDVDYLQNITDIDDKIITRAKENHHDPLEWAKEYEDKFLKDMENLGVTAVSRYASATHHIEQVVNQVKTLQDKGYAYLIEESGWYFDISTFKDYGKLSRRKASMADDAVTRIDENDKKRNRGDFCLWKFPEVRPQISKEVEPQKMIMAEGEPVWNTELGWGRPGWHIEDTAITEHYFGPQYDIHGGGQDLIFPHHEAEITQQESASGKKPFVKYWMHVAFLVNRVKSPEGDHAASKAQKMSKSLGNFETVNELLKKYPKEVLRFYLLSSYYRTPLDYSDKMFKQAQAAIARIAEFHQKLTQVNVSTSQVATLEEVNQKIYETREKFIQAMDNDFNTPEAFAALFGLIRDLNPLLVENKMGKKQADEILEFLSKINKIIGIIPSEEQKIPAEVQELVERREKFRHEKNFEESDKIRAQLQELGWEVEDTVYGPLISKSKSV